MSRLSRQRRQNRLLKPSNPEPRDARSSLESYIARRVRNSYVDLKLRNQREAKRSTVIESPMNELRLDDNREVRQARRIHDYNKIRLQQSKNAVKPLVKINLDRTLTVDLPAEHPICVRREERRQLMFATGKAGKGGQRRPRQVNQIKLRCK